ncbi:ABC-type sugar transport system, periplasmic component [Hoeflea sp. IMCC20628]|uniref:substrate-binding domain-containing protein n=1 Tax=Hoeflea sp. IMCC20628 TaxID=1620421 RepID=UPI00063ADC64|nr:substrate-binding domain-containing protein [Hoeflea sp. IMCC20628]AKH99246.1 ABC-type sugar transport system, periplasmic component [Hoeflea sp. IMCC20628]
MSKMKYILPALLLASSTAFADEALYKDLPGDLPGLYLGASSEIFPSAYDDFKVADGDWKWCHSESYQGNPWRVTVTNELKRLVEGLSDAGINATFEISDSNGDVGQQINQIRTFIDRKCTVITSVVSSSTALNDAIKAAYDAGIPFITAAGAVTSPYAINVDSNYYRWGYDMIEAIAKTAGEDATIMMVEGLAGHPIVLQEKAGADAALAEHPGIKVARTVNGNWTANVTKSVLLQALATYPGQVDAVWTTGSESRTVAEAFKQAGRDAPLITGSITGDALGYWNENKDTYRFEGHGVLPHMTAQTLFRAAVRVLQGQAPKLNTLMVPLPVISGSDLAGMYESCMTPDAVSVFPVPATDPLPADQMDGYFKNPAPVPGWDYAKSPKACN